MADFEQVVASMLSVADIKPATTPTIKNLDLVVANTEYEYQFPINTRAFSFMLQVPDPAATISFYYASGAADTIKLKGNDVVYKEFVRYSGKIYFKCDVAGKVVQIESWS